MQVQRGEIAVELDLLAHNLPVLMNVVEQSALVFGMQGKDALALTLAAEEVFNYLCARTDVKEGMRTVCKNGIYYVQIDFIFPCSNLDLRAFNLAADLDLEDDSQLEEMGLLIAARSVDRLFISDEPGRSMILTLYKEKSYPAIEAQASRTVEERTRFSIKPPDNEDLKSFCRLAVATLGDTGGLPPFMTYPGKFVDMIRSGEYEAALAFDERQAVAGGIVWRARARKTVELYGPYLLAKAEGMPEALIEHCLEQTGRSEAVGIINRSGAADLGKQYFEELGTVVNYQTDGLAQKATAYYRQLCEDPGQRIWAPMDLLPYLQSEYQRLFLPRDIRVVSNMGEHSNRHSVFSAELGSKQAILRPLLSGEDAAANLTRHLQLLSREKVLNIFFEMDLGIAWHAGMIPALLEQGFKPCLILPYAGQGDLLLMQFRAGDAQ
jgi:hypothetical protein